jgi:hypothetical protein
MREHRLDCNGTVKAYVLIGTPVHRGRGIRANMARAPSGRFEMRLQILTLTIGCLGAASALAGTGLTSAGIDPTPTNNQQDEPTLAQVAPVQGTTGTNAAGTVTPGASSGTAVQSGTIAAAGTAAGGNPANVAVVVPVVTKVVTPPPPPDPATLPVSVIRPINKTGTDSPAATVAPDPATTSAQQPRVSQPSTTPARPPATTASSTPLPATGTRPPPAGTSARPDAAVRTAAETPAEDAAASSSGFIFYTGIGIAATILLLSLAAFFRGGGEDSAKPRSM